MNSSSREMSGISLPPPMTEQSPAGVDGVADRKNSPEQQAASPEAAPRAGASQPAMALPQAPPTGQPAVAAPAQSGAQDNAADASSAAASASDDDKIEKEWVDKARKIVEHTKHDPHRQSEELTTVKADYMKQRYNKIIKVEK